MENQFDLGQAQDRQNWNPTNSLGRAGGSPIALRVGQSEVNETKHVSVSYFSKIQLMVYYQCCALIG